MRRILLGTALLAAFGYACGTGIVKGPPPDAGLACNGADLTKDPRNCGTCGTICTSTTCSVGRCTCTADPDCPSGEKCQQGDVCLAQTDKCFGVTCPPNAVCDPATGQ